MKNVRRLIPKRSLDAVSKELLGLSDETLGRISFLLPWNYEGHSTEPDGDGFKHRKRVLSGSAYKDDTSKDRVSLQEECWYKAINNPQINTSVRGTVGRLTGYGFEVSSENLDIQQVIDDESKDYRNRLPIYMPKYVARSEIEGELFLCLTCHTDGFIEIDFIDPKLVMGSMSQTGILMHPFKANLPLFYCITPQANPDLKTPNTTEYLIPSIFIARNPSLVESAREYSSFSDEKTLKSKNNDPKFRNFGGFFRFIVSWDRSFLTQRNISHLRTTIEWLNYYEELKKYEIDHKKSAGSYLWKVTFTEPKHFRMWLTMTDEQKRETGIMAKKTPGGTILLPPGMNLEAVNPQLQKISDSDTDVLNMAISGLNETQDVTMGSTNNTYGAVKASRGPMSDRISDEISYFENFLKYELWSSIFFLRSQLTDFPETFTVREVVRYEKKKKTVETPIKYVQNPDLPSTPPPGKVPPSKPGAAPVMVPQPTETQEVEELVPIVKPVKKKPEELIEINFPTSEITDISSRTTAYLGVKHGSVVDVLGIPRKEVAKKLGFGNYYKLRRQHSTEEENLPSLMSNVDQESFQEKTQAEPSPKKITRKPIPKPAKGE